MLKKYLRIFSLNISERLAYPANFYGYFLGSLSSIIVYYIIWKAVFSFNDSVFGYTFAEMISYYIVLMLFRRITSSGSSANLISGYIKDGTLSTLLVKPININLYLLIKSFSGRLVGSVAPIIIFVFYAAIFNKPFITDPIIITVFIFSILLAYLLNHYIYSSIGLVAFYTTNVWGIKSISGRFIDIFSGGVFPLDILPATLRSFVYLLPFAYMQFVPITIFTKNLSLSESVKIIGIQSFWLVILLSVFTYLFRNGISKYESIGI